MPHQQEEAGGSYVSLRDQLEADERTTKKARLRAVSHDDEPHRGFIVWDSPSLALLALTGICLNMEYSILMPTCYQYVESLNGKLIDEFMSLICQLTLLSCHSLSSSASSLSSYSSSHRLQALSRLRDCLLLSLPHGLLRSHRSVDGQTSHARSLHLHMHPRRDWELSLRHCGKDGMCLDANTRQSLDWGRGHECGYF